MTPEQLTAHLKSSGLDAYVYDHAGGPGSPSLPTVRLPDGSIVIIGNQRDGTEVNGEPLSEQLHAQRHAPDDDGHADYGDALDIFEGTAAQVVAEVWSAQQ